MDLGTFADEVLEAVAGICGDAVVESHDQAASVLDALLRRPGTDRRELAAAFGVSLEQLERCRSGGREGGGGEALAVYKDLCNRDAVYTWNVLIERINQAAHWREEFRELRDADETDSEGSDLDMGAEPPDIQDGAVKELQAGGSATLAAAPDGLASAETRARARGVLGLRLDAPDALRRRLVQRLDDEIFEVMPGDKDYRVCARSVAANLKRNSMLAAGYSTGRVPPQWLVGASPEALAPRMRQLQRRCLRSECLKEAKLADEEAELRNKAWRAARGHGTAGGAADGAQAGDPADSA